MKQKKIDEILVKNINNEKFERCVICGNKTSMCVSTPIELRRFYEIGCGQLCERCYTKLQKNEDY